MVVGAGFEPAKAKPADLQSEKKRGFTEETGAPNPKLTPNPPHPAERHFNKCHAVMSGIDYMTIARWVGHKDGGVLIGRVYGHLNDEHAKRQAKRLKLE